MNMNMGDALRMNARKFPDKLAARDRRNGVTYAQLDAQANALANGLLTAGLRKGQNVVVLMGNCVEHVVVHFGLAKAGLPGVPLDPKWREREIASALDFFDVAAVIAEVSVAPALLGALARLPALAGPVVWVGGKPESITSTRSLAYEDLLATSGTQEPGVFVDAKDLFLIMITSGTTGFPKGCLTTHEMYVFACLNHAMGGRGSGPKDTELLVSPLCFNSGRSSTMGHLFWGGTVILKERFDAVETLEAIQNERITYVALAPVMADRLLDVPHLDMYDTSTLRCLRKAGSPFHPRTVQGLIEHITPNVFQSYASTDAGSISLLEPEDQLRKSGSAGRLIWAAEVLIVDDGGTPVRTGDVGELICRGPLVCDGYYKNPEANARSFRGGWFLSGDLARFDEEGYLYIVGRKKNMIKSGSISIFPEEIQDLLQAHPKVREAAVVGVPHDEWGEAVLAAVSLRPGVAATEQELIEYCKTEIASYKAPKAVRFLDELPHTELGKIATETVRSQFRNAFIPLVQADPIWQGR